MSWYNSPLQPIDPVVISQQPKPAIRYLRDNFSGTGQNSYVKAPAQDQSLWQSLTNVMPITQGVLNPRWGYTQFYSPLTAGTNRLYDFQSDSLGTRAIIGTGPLNVAAVTESGTSYNANIFTPVGTSGIIRSITSRNYQYFCDGDNTLNTTTHATGDSLKWNGAATGGVSNIGIVVNDTTANTSTGSAGSNSVGPNGPTAFAIPSPFYPPWTNDAGLTNATGGYAQSFVNSSFNHTDQLFCTGYNFSVGLNQTIVGIQVTCNAYESFAAGSQVYVALTQNGTTTVGSGFNTSALTTTSTTYNFGGPTNLWGTAWTPSNILSSNFGVAMLVSGWSDGAGGGPIEVFVQNLQVTIFLANVAGGATSSGGGVGIVSIVNGGNISLVLGRTYYLVANNSSTGHFSDLSPASLSTGTITDSEVNLLLATFNDPQVDYKYLLATADGGDPSILYEVQPIVPGLTVSSWSINGSNVVTFTGQWTGTPYTAGTSFSVGGLVHGFYLNALNGWTVTSTSATTLVATVPGGHGSDSATEIGVAGTQTFAIPNSVGLVVDNTNDAPVTVNNTVGGGTTTYVGMVSNQVLLYTDQFGDEYGVTLNDPPPAGTLLLKHQGRLWMAGVAGATHSVYYSKSVTELTLPDGFIAGKYEECWPGSNYFDVSDGAESVSGLLTDGTTLYIGTQNHIRRLVGNAPSNFQEPQIIHPQVGLINQEVWQIVFTQGAPAGSIWMTPDFRVMQSDFNTYVDIGTPIQNILNALQPTAQTLAHGAFVADGEYELYILAVPYLQSTYCDLHLVFDLRARQWCVWEPTYGSQSLLFNISQAGVPQWLFINGTNGLSINSVINIYNSASLTDNGTAIPVTATTTWMHLGEATRRKVLNELQVYGDPNMLMTVYGANNQQDFNATPRAIVYNRRLKQSPFGTWNLYLTGAKTKHRYYQFTFNSSTGVAPLLGSYAIASTPLDDL